MTDTNQTPSPDETGGVFDPAYSKEPVGGGAESVPDPDENPGELGDDETIASNDELSDGGVER